MKCDNCSALGCAGYEYPEEFCKVGGDVECPTEWPDGSCGCKLHPATVKHRLLEAEKAIEEQYQDIGEWFNEQEYKDKGIDVSDPKGPYVLQAMHAIGLDYHSPYTRHGKKWYRPYRNYFNIHSDDPVWTTLVKIGYAVEKRPELFRLTDAGIRWLGRVLGVEIRSE